VFTVRGRLPPRSLRPDSAAGFEIWKPRDRRELEQNVRMSWRAAGLRADAYDLVEDFAERIDDFDDMAFEEVASEFMLRASGRAA
jgi:hypothetical protein